MTDWARQHVHLPGGLPYDHEAYPHLGAPGGPCDAVDDPLVRVIWLQFASRLGKTVFGLSFLLYASATAPGPGMFVSSREKLAKEIINTRLYPMLELCQPLRPQLKPEHRRKADRIDLRANRIYVGWARSPSTLADKGVKYGLGNEVDKWEQASTSMEGDPLELFGERHKDYPTHKSIREGTPTVKGRSRVEAGRLASTNCHYAVPCPKCKRFQRLELGRDRDGGLQWEKGDDGHSDPDVAFRTAHYVCAHCHAKLDDEYRGWMMRRGVWVPEGCRANDKKAIKAAERRMDGEPDSSESFLSGAPRRNGAHAGYQLGSLYALSLSFGDYAQAYLRTKKKPQLRRSFVNSWQGETWEAGRSAAPADQLAERLAGAHARGSVPEWACYLVAGIDKQAAAGGFMPFVVCAFGAAERAALVEWGEIEADPQIFSEIVYRQWPAADEGHPFLAMLSLIDSGYDTKHVYELCRNRRGLLPAKGQDAAGDASYRVAMLGLGGSKPTRTAAKSAIGQPLVHVNVDYWEEEIQARLEDRLPGQPGALELPPEAARDVDLCRQLLNGMGAEATDRRGEIKRRWKKRDENEPNDYRDALRMALCAAQIVLDERGGRLPLRAGGAAAPKVHAVVNPGEGRPDGRPWV